MTQQPRPLSRVLVVGGTGYLGNKVVAALLERKKKVYALVRPGSDAGTIERMGAEVVRGDMMDAASLQRAMVGMDAVVTTAAGYMRRRKSDSPDIDRIGNRNLVDAAREADIARFVLLSILKSDIATDVPHFHHKKLVEDYLQERGVPFVSLRPGAFLDQSDDYLARGVAKGRILDLMGADTRYTLVLTDDLAHHIARAVDAESAIGQVVDIGCERALSAKDMAQTISRLLGRPMKVQSPPWWLVHAGMGAAGLFSEQVRDMHAMIRFIRSGRYVADVSLQRQLLGEPPSVEDMLQRWLQRIGVHPTPDSKFSA